VHLCRKLLRHIELSPERLRLEWMAASEGSRFAEVMSDFAARLRDLGPLGREEELDEAVVGFRLRALNQLVPYLKLVEREKLRVPAKSEEAYNEFYNSDEVNKLFDDLIVDKLAISQILLALDEKPLSTAEISAVLGLSPSEVSRYLNRSSRQGFVRFDLEKKRYALA
jgi:Fic family protein